MRHVFGVVAAVAAVCTLSHATPAYAGSTKAWTAAKASLPADTAVAVGVDMAAIASSATFAKLFPIVLGKSDDAKQALDLVKVACKMDPITAIRSIAVGLDASQSDGAVFMNVADLNPTKLTSCLKDIAKAKGAGAKVDSLVVKTDGGVTEMTADDKHLFFGWIGSDVLVMVPKHLDDKAALKAWMAGGFGKGALGKMMSKVNTGSAVFVASIVGKSLDSTHNMKQGFGWLTLAGGNMSIEFHGDLGDPAASKSLASDASTQLDQLRKNPPLPALGDMLKNVTIGASGAELVAKATVVEKDFADLIAMAIASM